MSGKFAHRPSQDDVRFAASEVGLELSDSDCASYSALLEDCLEAYNAIAELDGNAPRQASRKVEVRRPTADEDPHRAWVVRTDISQGVTGKLAGRTVGLKDNICLAGVPLENGTDFLRGFVPEIDAEVARRILDAGGRIVGKTRCEAYCASCASFTGAGGPVENPHRAGHSAGGSSSGSAAAVAAGEVDLAIGTDQGGSIRVPAALCGIVGMKPTYGLVPYTGIIPTELTLDHVGPMSRTVEDNALLLEVLAGPDHLDPRQRIPHTASFDYQRAISENPAGMRVGLVTEGFNPDGSDPAVAELVRNAAYSLRELGVTVEDVTVPLHAIGSKIWLPIILEGSIDLMFTGNGYGRNWSGPFHIDYTERQADWRSAAETFPEVLKVLLVGARWFGKVSHGAYYGRAQNAARRLRAAYDETLTRFDLLIMPTVPGTASPHAPAESTRELQFERAVEGTINAAAFDVTGHPAMTVPCGKVDGLPVGMMMIGRHFDEHSLYRLAHAFEQSITA